MTTCTSMPAAHLPGRVQVKFLVPAESSSTSAGVAVMSNKALEFSASSQDRLPISATLCCPGAHLKVCIRNNDYVAVCVLCLD